MLCVLPFPAHPAQCRLISFSDALPDVRCLGDLTIVAQAAPRAIEAVSRQPYD